jgi:hypothetical protein
VLKDAESRKKYDLYGEEGITTSHKQSYHSWSYYRDNFGIYDDDPEIVTLNKADFGKYYIWQLIFYIAQSVIIEDGELNTTLNSISYLVNLLLSRKQKIEY